MNCLTMRVLLLLFCWIKSCICISDSDGSNSKSQVILFSHPWCRKCDKPKVIFEKLQQSLAKQSSFPLQNEDYLFAANHYTSQQSQVANTDDDLLLRIVDISSEAQLYLGDKISDQTKQLIKKYKVDNDQLPLPSIWIRCKHYIGFYNNEITYSELSYWIKFYSRGILPKCKSDSVLNKRHLIVKDEYEVPLDPQLLKRNESQSLRQQILRFPFINWCIKDGNDKEQRHQSLNGKSKVNIVTRGFPFLFTKFNQNIRSFLFRNQFNFELSELPNKNLPVGLFLVFNDASHPKLEQFLAFYNVILNKYNGPDKKWDHQKSNVNQTTPLINNKIVKALEVMKSHQQKQLQSQSLKNQTQKGENIRQNEQISTLVQTMTAYLETFKNRFISLDFIRQLHLVAVCYNEDKDKCIYREKIATERSNFKESQEKKKQGNRLPVEISFRGSKLSFVDKLFQFTHIKNPFLKSPNTDSKNQKTSSGKIFREDSLFKIFAVQYSPEDQTLTAHSYVKGLTEGRLGHDFIFWLQQVHKSYQKNGESSEKMPKKHSDGPTQCQKSEVIEVYNQRNLSSVELSVKLAKLIESLNKKLSNNSQIKLQSHSLKQLYLPGDRTKINLFNYRISGNSYQICVQGQNKKFIFYDFESLQQFLQTNAKQWKGEQLQQPQSELIDSTDDLQQL